MARGVAVGADEEQAAPHALAADVALLDALASHKVVRVVKVASRLRKGQPFLLWGEKGREEKKKEGKGYVSGCVSGKVGD